MYLPPNFKGSTRDHAVPLIRSHPFASLISLDDGGFPFVSHLPLHLEVHGTEEDRTADESLVLFGHVAKANPHWRYLKDRPEALVTFLGPHAYLSPQVYPDLARVPTWNYLAVHCRVSATLIEEPEAKDALLKKLIGDHEPRYAAQWRGLDPAYAHKMLAGIVGFELQVTQVQCKVKVNQHRPEAYDATRAMYLTGNDHQHALAEWMQLVRPIPATQP
ncbi:MAG: FMN-binding negative transcriptional regulator [Pseudomonadota bacterium]